MTVNVMALTGPGFTHSHEALASNIDQIVSLIVNVRNQFIAQAAEVNRITVSAAKAPDHIVGSLSILVIITLTEDIGILENDRITTQNAISNTLREIHKDQSINTIILPKAAQSSALRMPTLTGPHGHNRYAEDQLRELSTALNADRPSKTYQFGQLTT